LAPSKKRTDSKNRLVFGRFGRKTGLEHGKKALYFALFHVLVVFCVYKLLAGRIFRKICPSKINRAEKPTVGFLFLGASGNIVA